MSTRRFARLSRHALLAIVPGAVLAPPPARCQETPVERVVDRPIRGPESLPPRAPPDTSGPALRPGDRVRLVRKGAPVSPFLARVVELRPDTLAVSRTRAGSGPALEWIPVAEIETLEVSRGREHGFWSSVGVGLGGGAFVGGLLGLSLSNWLDGCPDSDPHCDEDGEHLYVVPWVAAVGASLGLIAGLSRGLSAEEAWEEIPPVRLGIGPTPGDGFVAAVSFRVR
jgi:hypothetical protein